MTLYFLYGYKKIYGSDVCRRFNKLKKETSIIDFIIKGRYS